MARIHLFEFEDLKWFPSTLRESIVKYLTFLETRFDFYGPVLPKLWKTLKDSEVKQVIDLCSGAAGPVIRILSSEKRDPSILFTLTDKFPNTSCFEIAKEKFKQTISFEGNSVDAAKVPEKLKGFRTLFCSFHHFKPKDAKSILQNAVDSSNGIAIVEFTERTIPTLFSYLLVPFVVLLVMPFIRPFNWKNIFWSYIVPVLPFVIFWDGFISNLRTYSPKELEALIKQVEGAEQFNWEIGKISGGPLVKNLTYLFGIPKKQPKKFQDIRKSPAKEISREPSLSL